MKALDKHSTSDWQSFIAPIANRLMDFSKRNPLLNLDQKSKVLKLNIQIDESHDRVSLKLNADIKKLFKKKQQIQKEIGLNTLYLSWGIYEIQNEELDRLPYYLVPISIKQNKDKEEVELLLDWESKILNPLLVKLLKEKYNLEPKKESVSNWETHLGIFNYKKYILLDEISKMEEKHLSNPLRLLFDFNPEDFETETERIILDQSLIASADPSQRKIIHRSLSGESFCVQGPPGTGKSQTISNIISANLKQGKKILFVSEKRAAIEVVHEKLNQSGLGSSLIQITDSGNDKKDFIQSLSQQWENNRRKLDKEVRLEEYGLAYSKVERFLDHLFRFQNDLGMSLNDALKLFPEFKQSKTLKQVPSLDQWIQIKDLILFLYEEIENERISARDLTYFLLLNPLLLDSSDIEGKIDLHIKSLEKNLKSIPNPVISISELQRQCIQARFICGLLFKEKIDILKNPSQKKKFQAESKRYYKLKNDLDNLTLDLDVWNTIPSLESIEFWRKNLNAKGWFNSSKRKASKSMGEHLKSPISSVEELFSKTEKYHDLKKKWNTCLTKLKTEFQIHDPEREIEELHLILNKQEHQKSTFDLLLDKSIEELGQLDELNASLDKIIHSKKVLFSSEIQTVEDLFNGIQTLDEYKDFVVRNQEIFKALKDLDPTDIPFFTDEINSKTIETKIFQSNISKILNKSAILSEIDATELNALLKEIREKRNQNLSVNARKIADQLKTDFNELEELLITPAGRLQSSEKELKKSCRIGKRILTHEFSKTRSYKAIRELCEIESSNWVFSMKKVWMMNPLSVSEILPFEKEQFDLLVIDEASQIPEEDIIPSLYRAKQVIIVGDKMQMPPSNFFSGNEVGPSILDTAHFRLPNEMLKWHYRSQNPELIAFSNHSFYDSQLIVNPSVNRSEKAMQFHLVKDSDYFEGTNPKEAQEIVTFIESNLSKRGGLTGIGCFSLAQQKVIEKLISKSKVLKSKIEDESLFIRNLENLQGDECDHLIISIGYGPDKEGKLRMNFGPLSKNGGHNRLNVLITRARLTVDVFASFTPENLVLSDNEGINYLKEYLEFVQEPKVDHHWDDLKIQNENTSLMIQENTDIETLLSRYNVLTENGFKVSVETRLC